MTGLRDDICRTKLVSENSTIIWNISRPSQTGIVRKTPFCLFGWQSENEIGTSNEALKRILHAPFPKEIIDKVLG